MARTARKDKQLEILRSCFDCDHYAACRAQNGYPLAEKNADRCALYAEQSLLTQERERNIQIQDELNKDIVRLEAELEQVKQERDGLNILLAQAQSMLETRTRERDAAVADIPRACGYCKYYEENTDQCTNSLPCACVSGVNTRWQWRGVKED